MNIKRSYIKNTIPALVQILFVIITLVFPLYMMYRSEELDLRHYGSFFIRTLVLIILFYINYLILIDTYLFNKKFITYICINLALSAGLLLCQSLIIEMVIFSEPPFPPQRMASPGMMGTVGYKRPPSFNMRRWGDFVFVILVIGLSVALKATTRWYKDSINFEKIKTAQLEADLRNLRSQLNPHFLFNTLNNIYALIAIDSHQAQDSVHRLSQLLRYVLYENEDKFVPIVKELEFTENYIDLMKLRMASNIKLDISIKNDNSSDYIAPLMFITLIENAFKHGINNGEDSFINIKILIQNGIGVTCSVENSRSDKKNMESRNSGIGLTNLTKRLELLYPNQHQLTLKELPDRYVSILKLDSSNVKSTPA